MHLTRSLLERLLVTLPEWLMASLCHAEATSKMPVIYILVRNADDEITYHSGGFGFFYFYFLSYFHLDFSAFCDFSNIFVLSIEVISAVTF